jgi:hypothetical protein
MIFVKCGMTSKQLEQPQLGFVTAAVYLGQNNHTMETGLRKGERLHISMSVLCAILFADDIILIESMGNKL